MRYSLIFLLSILVLHSSAQFSRGVRLLSRWDSDMPVLNGSQAKYNDCWAFEWQGEEYAAIGSTMGTHVIHLAKNNATYEVGFIQGSAYGNYIVHRDFDFRDGYLYSVGDQEPGSLQIIDCRNLPHQVTLAIETTEFFTTCHNLFIDQATGKMYASGPSGHAMSILDVGTDPSNPTLLSHFDVLDYVHDCYVQNDTAYLHAANQGFYIFDTSNPTEPQALGSLTDYPDKGYNHSGWLTEDGQHYVFTDETPGMRLKICDVSDFSDIRVTDLFWSNSDPLTMVHNVMIKGDLAYVSHYFDGLEIYNISDPEDVRRIAWYDTFQEEDRSGRGAWGIHALLPSGKIIVSDRQTGLYVFQLESGGVYPRTPEVNIASNPGNGNLVVNLVDYDYNSLQHFVYDPTGKLVSEGNWSKGYGSYIPIDLRGMSPGTYLVQIKFDNFTEQLKYVLQE